MGGAQFASDGVQLDQGIARSDRECAISESMIAASEPG
jgi:hypothetical protein